MTKGTQIDGDEADRFPRAADELSASSPGRRIGGPVIPFPRRADTSVASGFAAGGDPPSPPASFEALGPIVQSVVMRIKDSRVRLKVTGPAREVGEDLDRS